ncbi:VOC family protein [Micromonospora sp. M12]
MLTLTFDAYDPASLARFWAGMLGREVVEDSGSALLLGDDTRSASGSSRALPRSSGRTASTCT